MGVDYAPGRGVTLESLQSGLEKSEREARESINALFLENGLSLSPPVELYSDGQGAIRVAGEHPQKEQIEGLLAARPDLANDFRKASALSSLVKAGEEYLEFAAAYERDPYAAVARFGHLFDNISGGREFSLMFGEG